MPCTCVIVGSRIASLCDIHHAAQLDSYNRAIESAALTVMNACNDGWLVQRVRGMKVSAPYKRCEGCDD